MLATTDVDADCARLAEAGTPARGPDEPPWGHMASFTDPDGNGLMPLAEARQQEGRRDRPHQEPPGLGPPRPTRTASSPRSPAPYAARCCGCCAAAGRSPSRSWPTSSTCGARACPSI
ncbi:VOC family protein [Streptomyces pseudovenezuelae]|uniref:VOC family protein n=1 Tax=Streptomyces pseudovenezuelae TaxID=67350 RepID=UPI0036F0B862